MSDMRDFNNNVSEEIHAEGFSIDNIPDNDDDLIAQSDDKLASYHVIETEEASNTGRIVGALAVALLLGTAGAYAYHVSTPVSPPVNQVAAVAPAPAAPQPAQTADTSANTSQPSAPSEATPASQPASAPARAKPSASRQIRAARVEFGSSSASPQSAPQTQQQPAPDQSAAAVQPAAPAGNPSLARNEQTGADMTPSAPASDAPVVQAPAVQAPVPAAPEVTPPAQPAPAPSDQPAMQ